MNITNSLELRALPGRREITGSLTIEGLTSLAGLTSQGAPCTSSTTTRGPALRVSSASLSKTHKPTSLAGLEGLTSVGDGLYVFDNDALPQCQADALALRLGKACTCFSNDDTTPCDERGAQVRCGGQAR
ncbi:MAG: hypothetical protein FJ137_08500 [Deltaproteobacteria bacterium]|nr:hypothetical protein [Deltaproteobacteria bacterium]